MSTISNQYLENRFNTLLVETRQAIENPKTIFPNHLSFPKHLTTLRHRLRFILSELQENAIAQDREPLLVFKREYRIIDRDIKAILNSVRPPELELIHFNDWAMAGHPVYFNYPHRSYGRKFAPPVTIRIRADLSEDGHNYSGVGYLIAGAAYRGIHITQLGINIRNEKMVSRLNGIQGGGYFYIVNHDPEYDYNCFQQAVSNFSAELEKKTGLPFSEIAPTLLYEIDSTVEKHFKPVLEPKDGNLVIYSVAKGETRYTPNGTPVRGTTHAGIFRERAPNWNSPPGGVVESRFSHWMPVVAEHDIFFVPDFYGDEVRFYEFNIS